ncbi:MAG: sulfatase family protein, partial [Limisphaerales bacterium]
MNPRIAFCAALIGIACTINAAKRPNILFAFADDWGRVASAYAGIDGRPSANDVISTPNFDRVARQGVLFKNAFVTAPSCTPCRSSILSGQYFFRTGRAAILQGAVWEADKVPSFPPLLAQSGYHIGETYKVWSPGTPKDAQFGPANAYEKAGSRFNQFSQNVDRMTKQGKSIAEAKQVLFDEVKNNFQAFLSAREKGKPFMYWFGPTEVHRKWIKGSGKELWEIDPDDLQGKLPKFMPDVPEVRQDFADYMGEIQSFDTALGLLLKKLEDIGELKNTIVVVSGDHGPPGFPGGKCNLYDYGVNVPLAIHWPGKPGGRVVDDFVNLMDLAPTFLEAGAVDIPKVMTGRSLVNVLKSKKSGWVGKKRSWVITGRERHVAMSRPGFTPYPQRSYRTKDFLYIINFRPDRWPMGDPFKLTAEKAPDWNTLENQTFVTFADFDASPTKAWLVDNRNDPKWKWHYDYAFGKRPRIELYDLKHDPDQIKNVAGESEFAKIQKELNGKLMRELKRVKDPRVTGD